MLSSLTRILVSKRYQAAFHKVAFFLSPTVYTIAAKKGFLMILDATLGGILMVRFVNQWFEMAVVAAIVLVSSASVSIGII